MILRKDNHHPLCCRTVVNLDPTQESWLCLEVLCHGCGTQNACSSTPAAQQAAAAIGLRLLH
jgi:hypothetical protein